MTTEKRQEILLKMRLERSQMRLEGSLLYIERKSAPPDDWEAREGKKRKNKNAAQ
ncbi:hypothetical protein K5D51_02075 [Pseudomonas cichorii]|nr:hypothetical protein [Pseudomonas cichorii]MBX8538465.1 hypothetical protein [Pseudomonas cichorii]MBX8549325.1 hypothetical protein [Pseudomonas cichorii]MBX8578360.1 hypothetical protein [Pseudomonas cichorii]MBX8595833.1 hypothetical protein [Pseudomonas cichorii]